MSAVCHIRVERNVATVNPRLRYFESNAVSLI
jgi:hypothetical protein